MINLFGLLNMGKDSLSAQQRALDVTSHNIANSNTEGYSRQRAIMGTNPPLDTMTPDTYSKDGQYGTGVQVEYVQRVRNLFLDKDIREATQSLNSWQSQEQALSQVEGIFLELGDDAINSYLDKFWNAWEQLSQDPTSPTYRMDVLQKGQNVADTLNRIYTDLGDLRKSIDDVLEADVEQINIIADKIAKLNTQIMQTEATGQHANDLRDQRDLLIDQLSVYADIQVYENDKGGVVVSLNEYNLVQDGSTMRLDTVTRRDGLHDIVWEHNGREAIFDSGSIGGALKARDEIIPDYMNQVATFSQNLATTMNAQHSAGLTLSGAPAGNFFFFDPATKMLSVVIGYDSLDSLAAARVGQGGGDNGNAIAIESLRDQVHSDYARMVTDYGEAEENALMYVEMKGTVLKELNKKRDSISGVSLDEEMANMVKFQQAYNAAARMITAVDEMMDTVINKMGVVGR